MRSFDIPEFYRSPIISKIKTIRKLRDPKKKDLTPSILDFGSVKFYIARHFGFCFGVENAVEISFRAIDENPDNRIFLLSQMIHNPEVNKDLIARGVRFLMDTNGKQLIPWEELKKEDVVIVPAFGTTLEIESKLKSLGIEPTLYNTTCPFVERVWKKSSDLSKDRYTIIIHGKPDHEETKATFSHSAQNSAVIVVKDMEEARMLTALISGSVTEEERSSFLNVFRNRTSSGFSFERDLQHIGVINQTTMLATETQAIADHLKKAIIDRYGEENSNVHFADTRDTLCYATNENQDATYGLLETDADLAIVVGGYNSSNTSHLVELCERKFKTYFIKDESELISEKAIRHFDLHSLTVKESSNWLPAFSPVKIALSSGASCPDSIVDRTLQKLLSLNGLHFSSEEILSKLQ